jgi:archaellum component FlaC
VNGLAFISAYLLIQPSPLFRLYGLVMAEKSAKKKSPKMADRLDNIERLVRSGFRQVDRQFGQVDRRFGEVDKRFGGLDQRLDGLDHRLDGVEQRLDRVDQRLDGVEKRLDGVDQRLDRVEQRMDILDLGLRDFKTEVNQRFAIVDERFNTLAITSMPS